MPGAKITERIDERHFKGTVTVKVGPATLSFRGDVEMKELDAANRCLRMAAKGTDATGSSAASLELKAVVRATEDGMSALSGSCEASVSGRAATFGGRMMDTVADQILRQFAANFAARVQARQPPRAERLAARIQRGPEPDPVRRRTRHRKGEVLADAQRGRQPVPLPGR